MIENIKSRKAQEEVVGFVLVVIVVSVIFLIFLGIFLRKGNTSSIESQEMSHFLKSMLEFTSNCSLNGFSYEKMSDLIGDCYERRNCESGEPSCMVVNLTMKGMLEASFSISADSVVKYYSFNSIYLENLTQNIEKTIIEISKGNCTNTHTMTGSNEPYSHRNGIIRNSISVCY